MVFDTKVSEEDARATATVTDRSFEEKPKVEVYPKSKKDEKPIKGGKKEYSSKGITDKKKYAPNAYVDIHGPEVPIMDGSSASFILLVELAGIKEQQAPKKFLRIKKNVRVEDDNKFAEFKPYNGYRLSFQIEFEHPMIQNKLTEFTFDFSTLNFLNQISRARTFGFLKEIETLRANNLALGGSLDNAIVLDDYRILNQDGLRFDDELVRHKILDAIGDLYLMGHILVGEFNGFKSGHELNNKLIRKLYADETAWEEVQESEITDIPISYWTAALGKA